MSKDGIASLLMILNVNTYPGGILERSLRALEYIDRYATNFYANKCLFSVNEEQKVYYICVLHFETALNKQQRISRR